MCWQVVEMYAKSGNKNANLSFLQNRNKQNKQKGRPARTQTQIQHLHAWKARRGRSSPALTGPPEGMQGRKGEEEIRYEKCLRDRQQKQNTQGRVREIICKNLQFVERHHDGASEVAVAGWGATQHTELRKFRLLSLDLKVRLSATSRRRFSRTRGAGAQDSPLTTLNSWSRPKPWDFSLALYSVTPRSGFFDLYCSQSTGGSKGLAGCIMCFFSFMWHSKGLGIKQEDGFMTEEVLAFSPINLNAWPIKAKVL